MNWINLLKNFFTRLRDYGNIVSVFLSGRHDSIWTAQPILKFWHIKPLKDGSKNLFRNGQNRLTRSKVRTKKPNKMSVFSHYFLHNVWKDWLK
jgi:hypothetical protein